MKKIDTDKLKRFYNNTSMPDQVKNFASECVSDFLNYYGTTNGDVAMPTSKLKFLEDLGLLSEF